MTIMLSFDRKWIEFVKNKGCSLEDRTAKMDQCHFFDGVTDVIMRTAESLSPPTHTNFIMFPRAIQKTKCQIRNIVERENLALWHRSSNGDVMAYCTLQHFESCRFWY
ncbi:uncharacterized protein LOC143249367 isoform X2 [Tachypleus tridentatus]|uniref:uncharacterized protein LOC143249367 isoform X2 n=1 Tax=Tachypleus tridentatus TaxID=6853 RepID=UPI003FD28804